MVSKNASFYLKVWSVIFWIGALFTVLYLPVVITFLESKKSINVFMWSGTIAPEVLNDFQKKTGIEVCVSYYEGNEELIAKLLATRGKGYDLIVPSDYAVDFLIRHDLLKKLDKSKLPFFKVINPKFLDHYYDPGSQYSVPAEWYILGFGVEKRKYTPEVLQTLSWDTFFRPQKGMRVGSINDSKELANLALYYLFKELRPLSSDEVGQVVELLRNQKKYVEAYSDFRGDFLLQAGNCSFVLLFLSHIAKTLHTSSDLAFVVPPDWTFLGIENYAIPVHSEKQDLVYQLINYLFDPKVQEYNFKNALFLSTRADAQYLFSDPVVGKYASLLHPDSDYAAIVFKNVLTDDQVNKIWLQVKGV